MKKQAILLFSFLFICLIITNGCSDEPLIEICNNGSDDDGDGLIDCADADCDLATSCLNQASDKNLKNSIKDLKYGSDELMLLRPVSFKYNNNKTETHLGLIAQELEQILPEAIVKDSKQNKGYMSISYPDVISVLIKASQEQQILIEENRALILEVKALQEQVNQLETRN